MNRHSWLVFVSVTYEKMTGSNNGKRKKRTKTPRNNKSVTTTNVGHLSNGEKRFISVSIHT